MALQVAERAVVGHEFEAVVRSLEGAARTVTTILALPHVGRHQASRVRRRHRARHAVAASSCATVELREDDRLEYPRLAVGVEGDESNLLGRFVLGERRPHRRDEVARRALGLGHVRRPRDAAFGHVDALEERRDDLHEFVDHELPVVANLGQRMGAHVQQAATRRPAPRRRCRGSRAHWPATVRASRRAPWRGWPVR